jgi:phage terminase large subunit
MNAAEKWTAEEEGALETAVQWYRDPVLFVRQMFGAEPDPWQADALRSVAVNPRTGMSASKGPGKSACLAWAIWWWLYTRVDAQAIALSITADNLRDNLWKELSYWYAKAPALQRAFVVQGERITHSERPKTWWVSARAFAQNADPTAQSNTLAGFHGGNIMVALDEMGDYPEGVVQAAEAIFATAGQNARLVAAWNCTNTSGPAYRVSGKDRQRWHIVHISGDPDDPKRSSRVDIEWARQMREDWGEDSPIYRINVLGLFPLTGSDKLLGPDDITKAEERDAVPAAYRKAPIVWGLDCARFGTDKSKLYKRQGPILFRPWSFTHCDGPDLANKVSHVIRRDMEDKERNPDGRAPDYLFVDVTGIGASPYDHLKLLGWQYAIPVDFGSAADDDRFADKRAEMYWRGAHWLKTEGCLPSNSGELGGQLCAPKIEWKQRGKRTCFVLESKEQMRARGLPSPDDADAFVLTFYTETPVRRDNQRELEPARAPAAKCRTEYDRYAKRSA